MFKVLNIVTGQKQVADLLLVISHEIVNEFVLNYVRFYQCSVIDT
jgi:hypothetical protein